MVIFSNFELIIILHSREYKERTEIQHFPQNYSVTFKERRFWHFEPSLSGGTLNDYITTVNMPVLASQEAKRADYWQSFMLDATYSAIEAGLFVNKTVKELLFDGYDDTLLSIAQMAGAKSRAPLDKFGWFYKVYLMKLLISLFMKSILSVRSKEFAYEEYLQSIRIAH